MPFSKYNTDRFKADPPVKEGQTYDVEILSIGEKGDGIAKVEGFVIVVPGTKKGDKVKVKINAVRGKVSFGEVVGAAESTGDDKKEEDSNEESGDFEAGAGGEDEDEEEEAEESAEEVEEEQ